MSVAQREDARGFEVLLQHLDGAEAVGDVADCLVGVDDVEFPAL